MISHSTDEATVTATTAPSRSTDIAQFLRLIHEPGSTYEIRIPDAPQKKGGTFRATASGYFDDPTAAAKLIQKWEKCEPRGIYLTLNPVNGDLLARSANAIEFRARTTSSDADIIRRRWLMIDIDPVRSSGISATNEESEYAVDASKAIREWLTNEHGYPAPIRMMSGNGAYLLYRIDLPNDDESTALVKSVTHAIADRFTNPKIVDIDRSVFNAARIARVGGTTARKGSHVPDRPHRRSFFITPENNLETVSRSQLEAVASMAATPPTRPIIAAETPPRDRNDNRVARCRAYVATMPPAISGQDGHGQTLEVGATIARFGLDADEGRPIMVEYNQRCVPPWDEPDLLRKLTEGLKKAAANGETGIKLADDRQRATSASNNTSATPDDEPDDDALSPDRRTGGWSLTDLIDEHPERRPEVIEGLCRRGEIVNIIGAPKQGKSWFIYNLAFSLATGREWLGRPVRKSKVLLIDNEIHASELAFRLQKVSQALGVSPSDIADNLLIDPLRGEQVCLHRLGDLLQEEYSDAAIDVIILDAFYRFLPADTSENDNAQMTALYNLLDRIAHRMNATIILNHHTSKGDQSHKGVTDVGAGAGAMTRACDSHIILRPHELEDCAVMEAVCRSNRSPEPSTICFSFPLWEAKHIEPVLRVPRNATDRRQEADDRETDDIVTEIMARQNDWMAATTIRRATTFGQVRIDRCLARLRLRNLIEVKQVANPKNKSAEIAVFRNLYSVEGKERNEKPENSPDGTPNGTYQ